MKKPDWASSRISTLLLLITLVVSGCAPVRRYHPEPLSPPATAAELENRSLNDPSLEKFMEQNLGLSLRTWPIKVWGLRDLAFAAYYFNPQMQVARARAEAASAAIITAGERPNPMVTLRPGIPSPWLMDFNFNVPVQTAGRRRFKIKQAAALSQAAHINLAATAWKVRSRVRAALVGYFSAEEQAELAAAEGHLRARQVQGLEVRFTAGEISHPALAAAREALLEERLAVRAAEDTALQDRFALAADIGMPEAALDGVRLSWPGFLHPPTTQLLSSKRVQREAVLDRLDVRRALAEYAAAQDALQLEIARQYPNIQIGPGYSFEEGLSYFTTALALTLPVFNRNQGPIAQAEAARKVAAAQFMAVQSRAIAQSEAALARYRSALAEWQDAEKSVRQIRRVLEPLSERSVRVGETDWLALSGVKLQRLVAAGVALQALDRAQQALGLLEDAVERPLESGDISPLTSRNSYRTEDTKP